MSPEYALLRDVIDDISRARGLSPRAVDRIVTTTWGAIQREVEAAEAERLRWKLLQGGER